MLVKDYAGPGQSLTPHQVLTEVHELDAEELLNGQVLAQLLGYTGVQNLSEATVLSRGFRILHKIPRLPQPVIENLAEEFESLGRIVSASVEELDEVEGIGAVRARSIKEGLKRMREQVYLERNL